METAARNAAWLDKHQKDAAMCPGRPIDHVTGTVHGGRGPAHPARHAWLLVLGLPTITQIYEGTNQIQRMVMARQLLKGL